MIRDDVRAMHAYAVADATGLVKLDAMENPFPLPEKLRDQLASLLADLPVNRYPAPRADALRDALKRTMKVPDGCDVLLGNGSDELISLVMTAVARDGASVLSLVPGFAMFELSAKLARLAPRRGTAATPTSRSTATRRSRRSRRIGPRSRSSRIRTTRPATASSGPTSRP